METAAKPDPAGQTIDVDTLVRAMLDARTYHWRTPYEMAATSFGTACYLHDRGVVLTLGGKPFDLSGFSINKFRRLCEQRGLLKEAY